MVTAAAMTAADTLVCAPRGDDWLERVSQSGLFTPHDQVRIMAAELCHAIATTTVDAATTSMIVGLVRALGDPCGYVSQIAAAALMRSGDPKGVEAAARYWQAVAWDGALRIGANY